MNISLLALIFILAPKRCDEAAKECGYVEPLQKKFNSKEEALDYSIKRIIEPLKSESPREYGVNLDYEDYDVVSERLGKKDSVANYSLKYIIMDFFHIKHPYISLHGHPEEIFEDKVATQTFSFQDFKVFNNNNNEKESFVVNKHGQFCVFRKKDNFKPLTQNELLELKKQYDFAYHASWANQIKIKKEGKVIHKFHDYQGMHAFWQNAAKKYNFEYYTTYGTFEGIDAYEDYYYPELNPPQEPSYHKSFKL